MVIICGEKDRGRCSNENMEDGSEWTRKDRKTKTDLERCYMKGYEVERSTERRSTRPENVENENLMR